MKDVGEAYSVILKEVLKQIDQDEELNKLLRNPNRMEILNLVKKKPMSIADISKSTGLSYKNTFFHVKKLTEHGLLDSKQDHKSQGRKRMVMPTGKTISQLRKELQERTMHRVKQKLG